MVEGLVILGLVIISWFNWSRFYIKKQIRQSLDEVQIGNPVRKAVNFSHYLRYCKLHDSNQGEVIVLEYQGKKINIAPDEAETVLFVEENEEKN